MKPPVKITLETDRFVYAQCRSRTTNEIYELTFNKITNLANCTCKNQYEFNGFCWHKKELYKIMYSRKLITNQAVLAWFESEYCKI